MNGSTTGKTRAPVAKVTRPKVMELLPRERLFDQLDALRRAHSVPWIVAPAGSGKTSLLVSYIEAREIPAVWYRVDERDRDAAELFLYMRLALEAFENGEKARSLLPSFSATSELQPFARRFFESFFGRLPAGGMLILDDYHLAGEDATSWQLAIAKALECIPADAHVVVLSRQLPPAALARQQVHGDIAFLEAAELHMTEDEALSLAKRRRGDGQAAASRSTIQAIHQRTGGWVAGVSLLLRHDTPSGPGPLRADADVQPIFDYLASAVFSDLSTDAQRVLLYTACLPGFTAAQAAELSGVPTAGDELRALHRAGLFIGSDGADAEEFRLHQLFQAFVAHLAARRLDPAELRGVRRRAASLLQAAGRHEDAFGLLVDLEDHDALAELIRARSSLLVADGRTSLLERWFAALPARSVQEDGWLSYWQAMSTLTTAPALSRVGFERALDLFSAEACGEGAYLAWAGAIHAETYVGRTWRALEYWFERLAEIESFCPSYPSAEVGSQTATALLMGLALGRAPKAKCDHWASRALGLAENAHDPTVRVLTTSVLLLSYALQADYARAAPLVVKLTRENERSPAGLLAEVAAKGATTVLAWHQGDFAAGLEAAQAVIRLTAGRPVPMWSSGALVCGAWCAFDTNDLAEGQRLRDLLAEIAEETRSPYDSSSYHVVHAREAFSRSDFRAALLAAQQGFDDCLTVGHVYGQGICLTQIAFASFELCDHERGQSALESLKRIEEEHRDPAVTYWRFLLEADRAIQLGAHAEAVRLLQRGFGVGRQYQIYGAQAPTPERIAALCRVALAEGIEVDYARALIRKRRLPAKPPHQEVASWPWPIQIRTLGPTEILGDDGQALSFGKSKMPRLLLEAIVAFACGGRAVSAEKIASILWPDADGDRGAKSFEVTLVRLRRALGGHARELIRFERGAVSLDVASCWTDLGALDALLSEIARGNAAADLASLPDRLFALYRGPFGGENDDLPPSLLAVQQKTRAKVAAAVVSLSDELRRRGDRRAAEALCARAADVDEGLNVTKLRSA